MSHAFAAWHRLRHHIAQGAVLVCSSTTVNRLVYCAGLHKCLQQCYSRQGQGKKHCPCCQILPGLLSQPFALTNSLIWSSVLCRTPYLFAAVPQQAGAGQEVLPLLSVPAGAAVQGLCIKAQYPTVQYAVQGPILVCSGATAGRGRARSAALVVRSCQGCLSRPLHHSSPQQGLSHLPIPAGAPSVIL